MPEIQMPKLSDTMTEGTLVVWKKKKGDKMAAGDVIAESERKRDYAAASQTLARGRARGENRRRRAGESIARGATDRGRARRRSCECERNRPGRPGNRDRCARCFQICSRGRRPR